MDVPKAQKPSIRNVRGKGKSIKGSFLPTDINNVSLKNPNNTTPRKRQDSENGMTPGSSSKGHYFNQVRPQKTTPNKYQNGYGNGIKQGNGANMNGSNGQLGNTNLGMLINGLVLKINGKGGGPGHQGQVPNHQLAGPQPSHEELTMRLNTEALQRIDGSFKHLYGSASQVAVYDFDALTNYWTDTKTVGCLFLYSRSDKPEYGLVVPNRKGLKNLVMFFDKDSQVIPHEPYLLFRRGPNEAIKCIWFYKNSEFYAATELLKTMGVQFDHDEVTNRNDLNPDNSGSASGLQLINMLKISQAKYDDNSPGQKPFMMTAEELEQQLLQDVEEKPLEPPKTPQGDSNQHAGRLKSLEISESGAFLMKKFALMPSKNPLTTRNDLEEKTQGSEESISPRLNDSSRSMRTVEQLEKDLVPEISKLSSVTRKTVKSSSQDISNELLATLGITPGKDKASTSVINSTDISVGSDYSPKSSFMTPASRSRSESGRSGRKLTIDDLDGKLYDDTDEDMVREVVESLADLTELLLLSENVVGQSEPQLVWRKRSNLQNRPASALIQLSQTIAPRQSPQMQPQSNGFGVTPLTQNQLVQAMDYLFHTDSDFIAKIHEAYVKSLDSAWSNKRLKS